MAQEMRQWQGARGVSVSYESVDDFGSGVGVWDAILTANPSGHMARLHNSDSYAIYEEPNSMNIAGFEE